MKNNIHKPYLLLASFDVPFFVDWILPLNLPSCTPASRREKLQPMKLKVENSIVNNKITVQGAYLKFKARPRVVVQEGEFILKYCLLLNFALLPFCQSAYSDTGQVFSHLWYTNRYLFSILEPLSVLRKKDKPEFPHLLKIQKYPRKNYPKKS